MFMYRRRGIMKKKDSIPNNLKFTGTKEDTNKGKIKPAGKKAAENIKKALKK